MIKPTILFVTDLYYQAKQRRYADEDIYLTSQLRDSFNLVICHPEDTKSFENSVDAIICRNTGPVIYYREVYNEFRNRLLASQKIVYNSLSGRADMLGKQYLVDLTALSYPVIPTIDDLSNFSLLPTVDTYVVKPKQGADSHGLEYIYKKSIAKVNLVNNLLQPKIDFEYEVSFYYIDNDLQYALYAPDNDKRWQLEIYQYSADDLRFANKIIDWNTLQYGVQRVDACRTSDGELLLVELEDLNPYLSLLDINNELRQEFIRNFIHSLHLVIEKYCR